MARLGLDVLEVVDEGAVEGQEDLGAGKGELVRVGQPSAAPSGRLVDGGRFLELLRCAARWQLQWVLFNENEISD